MLTEITPNAWVARDGSTHRTQGGANRTNAALDIKSWISKLPLTEDHKDVLLRAVLADATALSDLLMRFLLTAAAES